MIHKTWLFISWMLILSFNPFLSMAQTDSVDYIIYTPDFKFRQGVFLNFGQVKANNPVPREKIISAVDLNEMEFYEELFKDTSFYIFDELGMKKEIKVEEVWGFSHFGALFILHNDEFNRIPVVGAISHFVANMKVVNDRPYDYYYRNPYYYNDPFYRNRNRTYVTKEMRQYMLDWETGNVMDYDHKSLKVILMRDPELYEEYNNLSKRKQKKMVFLYLRKYNDRNPLKIPVNSDSAKD